MIAIVTDSTSYFSKKDAKDLGVIVVPLNYSIGSQTFNEDFSDCNTDITPILKQNPSSVTTSHASVGVFGSVFKDLVEKNYNVLCIVLSSRLSGAYSSASIAAKDVSEEKIMVVDSLTTAGALQLLVTEASKLSKSGLTLKQLYEKIEKLKNNVGLVFSVDDIGPLRKSGRLGVVQQSITTVLNIRPILACQNGTVVARGLARGRQEQTAKLIALVPKDAKTIVAHYIEKNSLIQNLYEKVSLVFPSIKILVSRIGPVLETHIGSGIIGLAWINAEIEK